MDTHDNINKNILDKINDNNGLTHKELYIINKYKDIKDNAELFFNNILSISNDINKYLNENCNHNWEIDYIDIDPETNKQIKYCNVCNITYN